MPATATVRRLSIADAAYIAGLVDGEGTVTLTRQHANEGRRLVVSISNNERPLLEFVLRRTGVGKITSKKTYRAPHRPSFAYQVSSRQALDLLRRIAPHLRGYKAERARLALAASWGSSDPTFVNAVGNLADVRKPETLDRLWLDVERNPDLARWTTELEQRAATLSLAEAQAVPDVTVSAGGRYYQDEGTGGVVALFSVPLPVFNRNQGAIQAAQNRLDRAKVERRVAEVSIRGSVAQAYQQLLAAYGQVVELRDRTIPQAKNVFRGAQDAYARGLFRYIEVLDAQRTLFQLRATYVDALLAYHTQITDIARLTGRDPSDGAVPASGVVP